MNAQQLRNSILQQAIQGKLVPQDPADEPASVLLQRIRKEKERLVKEGKLKKKDLESKPIEEDEIPFEIPENWEWVRLQYLCTRFSTGPFGTMVHKEDYVDLEGHPLVNPTNIKNEKIVVEGIKKVSNTKYKELGSYVLQTNDLVLARRGDLSKIAIVTEKENGWLAGTGAFFMHFLDGLFLPYFIVLYSSFYCQSYLLDQSVGGTMNNLNQKLLSDFLLPLPPLAEQRRIVAKIEELMPLVERYGKAQQALDQLNESLPARLRQSILQEAIQGRLVPQDPKEKPASELLKRIRKEKEQLVKEGKLKKKDLESKPIEEDEIPFEIPGSWEWCRLKEAVYNHGQKVPDKRFSYIDIGSIDNKRQRLNEKENIIEVKDAPSRARRIVKKDDIVYSTVRPYLHNVAIVDKEFSEEPIASTGFAVFSCFNGVYNKFLFYYLLSPEFDKYANDGDNAKGVAYPAINDEKLYKAIIPLPPLSEQKRIVAKVEELFGVMG